MKVNFLAECDYAHGYHKALIDVKNWFDSHSLHSDGVHYETPFCRAWVLAISIIMFLIACYIKDRGNK